MVYPQFPSVTVGYNESRSRFTQALATGFLGNARCVLKSEAKRGRLPIIAHSDRRELWEKQEKRKSSLERLKALAGLCNRENIPIFRCRPKNTFKNPGKSAILWLL